MQTIYDVLPNIDQRPGRLRERFPDIQDQLFWDLYERAKPYSMLQVTGFTISTNRCATSRRTTFPAT